MPDLTDDDFLRAFGPHDASARAVYADWLDERNDPRAEYVRLVVRAAEVAARLSELRKSVGPEWARAVQLAPHPPSVRFGAETFTLRHIQQVPLSIQDPNIFRMQLEQRREDEYVRTDSYALFLPPAGWPDALPPVLPGVFCVGGFAASAMGDGRVADKLYLEVIWTQHDFATPIAPEVLDQMAAADWRGYAVPIDH